MDENPSFKKIAKPFHKSRIEKHQLIMHANASYKMFTVNNRNPIDTKIKQYLFQNISITTIHHDEN